MLTPLRAVPKLSEAAAVAADLLGDVVDAFSLESFDLEARSAPWTGVNNCTEGIPLKTEAEQKQISFKLH